MTSKGLHIYVKTYLLFESLTVSHGESAVKILSNDVKVFGVFIQLPIITKHLLHTRLTSDLMFSVWIWSLYLYLHLHVDNDIYHQDPDKRTNYVQDGVQPKSININIPDIISEKHFKTFPVFI